MMTGKCNIASDSTVAEAVHAGTAFLKECQIDNADYDSFAIFSYVTGMNRTDYFLRGRDMVEAEQLEQYVKLLSQRAQHVPLQHILGTAWFYGYEFLVNSDVLIPRQDTEVLVAEALKELGKGTRILDMCTGSGCILLTLALEAEISQGYGVDFSEAALSVARQNQQKLKVSRIEFLQSNIFENVNVKGYGNLNLVISNPPYIRSDVIPTLSEEVKLHDPILALDGFEDGLFFYREITKQAHIYLKTGGWLMYEIGHDQGEAVTEIMQNSGFTDVKVVKDLAGLDRVVRGRLL